MKKIKITLLALTIAIFISCSTSASYLASKVYIGMPISDFLALSEGRAKLESIEDGRTIYRAENKNDDGRVTDTKFFYFDSNGKLDRMDGGVSRQTRQQIEIINK
jgi:hypothetical protein